MDDPLSPMYNEKLKNAFQSKAQDTRTTLEFFTHPAQYMYRNVNISNFVLTVPLQLTKSMVFATCKNIG